MNREWEKVQREGRALQANLERLVVAGARSAAQRAAIARLRNQVNGLKIRFDRLDAERSEHDGVLKSVPPVEELVSKLQAAGEIQFRVFAVAGEIEVDLVQSAGWEEVKA